MDIPVAVFRDWRICLLNYFLVTLHVPPYLSPLPHTRLNLSLSTVYCFAVLYSHIAIPIEIRNYYIASEMLDWGFEDKQIFCHYKSCLLTEIVIVILNSPQTEIKWMLFQRKESALWICHWKILSLKRQKARKLVYIASPRRRANA